MHIPQSALALALSLLFGAISSVGFAHADNRVVIEIRQTATSDDDYLCWSPVLSRARLISSEPTPIKVKLVSDGGLNSGAVGFAPYFGFFPTPSEFNPSETLEVTLPSDGGWVPFLVAGTVASTDGQDVRVVAQDSVDSSEVGATPVMVRVRKNAETLSPIERERLLEALSTFHGHLRPMGPIGRIGRYAEVHNRAFNYGIHGGQNGQPLFLSWHRAFLMSIERELQAIDARVTLPYWRYDEDSSTIFQPNFMGIVEDSSNIVRFSITNPLRGWHVDRAPLTRLNNPNVKLQDISNTLNFDLMPNIIAKRGRDTYGGVVPGTGINADIEWFYHNQAHIEAGGGMNSGNSPRDPLFYLLHANVDRAWAEWQAQFDRFDPVALTSYSLQGAYPGLSDPMRQRKGTYAEDTMWPWSQELGGTTPNDLLDDWPTTGFPFPKGFANETVSVNPTPKAMIDYQNRTGTSVSHNVCYDNLGYKE